MGREFKRRGVEAGVFGDIDQEDHRAWMGKVSKKAGLEAIHPLWNMGWEEVIEKFISLGFKAVVIAVDSNKLGPEYLGRELNSLLLVELKKKNVDPAGENGEYHTFVKGGPIFQEEIHCEPGEVIGRDGFYFQDLII